MDVLVMSADGFSRYNIVKTHATVPFKISVHSYQGDHGSFVAMLRCKSEGRWFDPSWCD